MTIKATKQKSKMMDEYDLRKKRKWKDECEWYEGKAIKILKILV